MGRKKLTSPSQSELYEQLSKLLVPEFILNNFEIYGVNEFKEYWQIELREKEHLIPTALQGESEVVLDGFCTPIQVLSHSFSMKPVYLKIYRRRWKLAGQNTFRSNEYDLTLKGLKIVPELGVFLKE